MMDRQPVTILASVMQKFCNAQLNNVPITMPDGEKVLTMKWDSRMSLRPIPQTAIDLNPLLATDQNPGY